VIHSRWPTPCYIKLMYFSYFSFFSIFDVLDDFENYFEKIYIFQLHVFKILLNLKQQDFKPKIVFIVMIEMNLYSKY
jgi:hypothetical protein